jgi:hypothetical protein
LESQYALRHQWGQPFAIRTLPNSAELAIHNYAFTETFADSGITGD